MEDIIKIDNVEYYEDTYVLKNAPIYSKTARSSRDLVKKRNITEDNFIYARKNKNNYVKSSDKSAKFDRILFKKEFVLTIPEIKILIEGDKVKNEEKVTDLNGVEKAPDILKLNDNEKFSDINGNIYNIETRGKREHDKIYFKVKDVENAFNMQRLQDTLIDKRCNYLIDNHYKVFICKKSGASAQNTNKKELFLTYEGLLKVLFASNNNKTSKFISWATKTLFTAQMGTKEQKDQLVSDIKGVSYKNIQQLFSVNARELPCIYLTSFNYVSVLREKINIDKKYNDNSIVYKFGYTNNFEERKNGHKKEYKDLADLIDMKLSLYGYIDPLYVAEAEKELHELLQDYKIKYDKHNEIIILSDSEFKLIKNVYNNISMKYAGHTTQLKNEYENKIKDLQHQIELLQQKTKLELEYLNKENQLLKELFNNSKKKIKKIK